MASIDDLPFEILIKIFLYLDTYEIMKNVQKVNRKYFKVSKEVLRESIVLNNLWSSRDLLELSELVQFFPKHLEIKYAKNPIQMLSCLSDGLVKKLNYSNINFSVHPGWTIKFYSCPCEGDYVPFPESLIVLGRKLNIINNLRELVIKQCCTGVAVTIAKWILSGAENLHNRIELNINPEVNPVCHSKMVKFEVNQNRICKCVASSLIEQYNSCLPKIVHYFRKNKFVTSERKHLQTPHTCLEAYTTAPLLYIFSGNCLTVIKASGKTMLDKHINYLVASTKNLKILHLYDAWLITSTSVKSLKELDHLESLVITCNKTIEPIVWRDFFLHHSGSLTRLGLDESLVDDNIITSVAQVCTKLRKLTLSGCRSENCLTSDSIKYLLSSCTELKYLDIRFTDRCLEGAYCAARHYSKLVVKYQPIN